MKRLYWHICAIVLITAVAAWLRLVDLGNKDFYNDEYYHVNTAVGYLHSGEFRQYNFYTQKLGEPYHRARLFTWQVAQSFKWFGISEASARLPAAVWGISLIPLLIIGLLKTTKHSWVAYGTGLWVTFDPLFVDQARFTRMYSMVAVLTVVSIFCLYHYFTVKAKRARYGYGIGFVLAIILDWLVFKELTLALLGGIAVYITVRTILFFVSRKPSERLFVYWWIGGAILALGLIGLRLAGFNTIPLDAAVLLRQPHWEYFEYLVTGLRLSSVAMIVAVIGLTSLWKYRSSMALVSMVSSAVLIYFVLFSRHEAAPRYSSFILPLVYSVMVYGSYVLVQYFGKRRQWRSRTITIVTIIVIGLLGPKLSWPGLPADGYLFQTAVVNATYRDLNRSNISAAYRYVAEQANSGDTVFVQGLRDYYWTERSVLLQDLGTAKSLSLSDFQTAVQASTGGVWVVYSQPRQRQLRPELRDYINDHFTKVTNLDEALVNIYYLAPN